MFRDTRETREPIVFRCDASSHNRLVRQAQWPLLCRFWLVPLRRRVHAALPLNMSGLLSLRRSLRSLPPLAARHAAGRRYHTERGVYGYRPKPSESQQKFERERIEALNQGQGEPQTCASAVSCETNASDVNCELV